MKKSFYLSIVVAGVLFGVENNATTPKHNAVEFDEIIVSATLTEVDNLKYAGSVGVVGEKELKQKSNVIDVIGDIPGVSVGEGLLRPTAQEFSIRGFSTWGDGDRLIFKQDGVKRDATLFSNQTSSLRVDNDILKTVEVTKGASSILHGSGAIGGIVDMTTKDARDYLSEGKEFGAMLGFRSESNNMKSGRAAVYADPNDVPIDILIYGKQAGYGNIKWADGGSHYSQTPTTKTNADEDIRTLFFKLGFDFYDSHRAQFSIFDYNGDLMTAWQPMRQNPDELTLSADLTQRDYVFDYFYTPANPFVNLSFKAYKTDAKYDRFYISGTDLRYKNEDERWGINLKNNAEFDTGFLNHNLVLGFDYQQREEGVSYVRNGIDQSMSMFASHPNKWKDLGIYLQDIISVGDFELTLGGRYDKFEREVKREYGDKFSDSRFSPRVALGYTIFDKLTLLAGYSESFRAPTPHEAGMAGPVNRPYWYVPADGLEPEIAKEYEIGFSYEDQALLSDDDHFNFKFIHFNGEISNFIEFVDRGDLGTPPPNAMNDQSDPTNLQKYGQYQNIGKVKRKGYEISTKYDIGDFSFGASYEKLKIYDAQTKEPIRKTADRFIGKVDYSPMKNLNLGVKVSHWLKPKTQPQYYYPEYYGTRYPYVDKPFTTVDFQGSYKVSKNEYLPFLDGATINFGVNNITDKQYIRADTYKASSQVGRGRNFWVDLEVKF
ncbi:TonB-dependent receptor [Campylobacter sp. JMF_06 NA1]|uniref:TonB-dependent receptor domain-containing protein n=1 Tax=Campylobacter sp. JMF_06 NA1 TaxID=2983823 RepID=UPI0022E99C27|nr:TonB-dependent receptor [Campylobacter sp. JMF_06 NA1]MDA3077552.1 TonB-dependent receptor [Campylobacter sp. JMF_06 NA1]